MKPPMMHTAYKVVTTRNAYGDFVGSSSVPLACHFRYITEQVSSTSDETIQSDAMAWFEPDSGIEKEDIIMVDGEHFRVERLIKGRRLRSKVVHFIKVDLLKYGLIS